MPSATTRSGSSACPDPPAPAVASPGAPRPAPAQPQVRAAPDGAVAVERRDAGDVHRLPAPRAGPHALGRQGGRRLVRPRRADGRPRHPGGRCRRPLEPAGADDRGRRGAGGRAGVLGAQLVLRTPPSGSSSASASSRAWGARCSMPPCPGAVRAVVPAEQLAEAAGARADRNAVVRIVGPPAGGALFEVGRAIPFIVDACSYACSTLSLLLMRVRFEEDRPPDVVIRPRPHTRGRVLHLAPALPPGHRVPLRPLQLHGPRAVLLHRRHREGQGLSGGAIGLLTALFAVSRPLRLAVLAVAASHPQRPRRAALEVWAWLGCALFLVWPTARRAGARPGPGRSGHPLDRLGRQRVPDRHHARPAARSGRGGPQHHRASPSGRWRHWWRGSCSSTPRHAGRRVLHRMGARPGTLGDREPVLRARRTDLGDAGRSGRA